MLTTFIEVALATKIVRNVRMLSVLKEDDVRNSYIKH